MRVTKPISSISYNTEPFLIQKLDFCLKLGLISYYEFIKHNGDTDTKKPHIHLYCIPSKFVDLAEFKGMFDEPDPTRADGKPLICEPFRVSNSYGDWYWYGLHDKDYLRAKMLQRNCHYSDSDIVSSCLDFHNTLVNENPLCDYANMSDIAIREFVYMCISEDKPLSYVLSSGVVPLGKTQSVVCLYNSLATYYKPSKVPHLMSPSQIKNMRKNNFYSRIEKIKNGSATDFVDDELF